MKYIDYFCAWFLFVAGLAFIVDIEIWHPSGAVLDTPILWIVVAMINILRLRNGYGIKNLKAFCISANLILLVVETVSFKLYPSPTSLIQGIPTVAETLFSLTQRAAAFPRIQT
jgi:hypothetical protein